MMTAPKLATMVAPWLVLALAAEGAEPAAPPGSQAPIYPHKLFTSQEFGSGGQSYWLFEPAEPRPERAAVVVFHHGWLAMNPGVYGAWIEHLARSGFVVIYPRYQADTLTPPSRFLPNALTAVKDALGVLQTAPGRVRPDRDRFALIGHSAGGNLSVQMAAVAQDEGLPRPSAVVAVLPGEVKPSRSPTLDRLPAATLLVVIAAEQDIVVGDHRARQIFAATTAVPPERKLYILYRTDRQGPIPLVADHLAPTAALAALDTGEGPFRTSQMAQAKVDILDRYGFWRVADLTLAAAFSGRTLAEATDGGALFRDLGRWGDGRPVTPPIVGTELSSIPRVFPAHGARLISWDPDDLPRLPRPARIEAAARLK
jgi:acetyl esterase/lipase